MGSKLRCDIWEHFKNIREEGVAVCKLCQQRLKNDRTESLRRHMERLHNTKSEIWNYFENTIAKGFAECKECKQLVRSNRCFNLKKHMLKVHNITILDIENKTSTQKDQLMPTATTTTIDLTKTEDSLTINTDHESIDEDDNMSHQMSVTDQEVDNVSYTEETKHNMPHLESVITQEVDNVSYIEQTQHNMPHLTNVTAQEVDNLSYIEETQHNMPHLTSVTAQEVDNFSYIEETQHNIQNSSMKRSILSSANLNKAPYKRGKKFIGIEMEEKLIKSAVWGLMIDEGVAPSLFGSKNMQALIQPICEAISIQKEREFKINEAEREGVLCSVANHLCKDFSNDLHWRLLSLKIDTDLNGPPNTFCVSVSFVNEGKLQTRILGVIDLKDNSQITEKHIEKVLQKFNIATDQIIFACWDNTKPKYNTYVENSEYLKEIVKIETNPDIQFGEIKLERYVGSVAHLCLMDIFKHSDILEQFLNCRKFVKFISDESNGFYDLFNKNNLNIPQLDSPWKWGSTYKMVSDLQEARKLLEANTYPELQFVEDQFEVNDNVWLFVDAFCESLKHIQKSITKYYTDEMHFGDFYAQWLKCKLLTLKSATTDNKENIFVNMISSQLLKCIDIRTKDILSKGVFQACLYMDPRFQHTLGTEEKSKAADYLKNIWSRSKIYSPELANASTTCLKETQQSRNFNDEEDAFLNEFLSQDAQKANSKTNDVYKKIKELSLPFTSVDTNILLFWNNLKATDPEMFFLSSICFAVQTTQNYNQDRYAHIYQTENNSKLSDSIRDSLEFVRLNSEFLVDDLRQFGIFCEGKSSDDDLLQVL